MDRKPQSNPSLFNPGEKNKLFDRKKNRFLCPSNDFVAIQADLRVS